MEDDNETERTMAEAIADVQEQINETLRPLGAFGLISFSSLGGGLLDGPAPGEWVH